MNLWVIQKMIGLDRKCVRVCAYGPVCACVCVCVCARARVCVCVTSEKKAVTVMRWHS